MAQLLDSSVYDLDTPAGQQKALQDIINQQNQIYDRSQSQTGYQVVAYTQLVTDLINGSPTGTYTATYVHGLGYPPLVLGYMNVAGPLTYAPTAYDEIQFMPGGLTNTYQSFRVDSQNLYMDTYARNLGGFFSTTHIVGSFYIFNLPLNI